jgi:hypothetical protein
MQKDGGVVVGSIGTEVSEKRSLEFLVGTMHGAT